MVGDSRELRELVDVTSVDVAGSELLAGSVVEVDAAHVWTVSALVLTY